MQNLNGLQKLIQHSKHPKTMEAIKHGVEIFNKNRTTCLYTDWSKSGIGYYLNQKHCDSSAQTQCSRMLRRRLANHVSRVQTPKISRDQICSIRGGSSGSCLEFTSNKILYIGL